MAAIAIGCQVKPLHPVDLAAHAPARIYVAGPIGADDDGRSARIAAAIDAGSHLLRLGHAPFVPHLWAAAMYDDAITADALLGYEDWMAYDLAFLRVCDAVLRIPGESPGADREVQLARELGKHVYFSVEEIPNAARR